MDDRWLESRQGLGIFLFTTAGSRQDLGPNEYEGPFSWGQSSRDVRLTTHLHLVPRSRMRGAIPPIPRYVFMVWCSVKKKEQGQIFLNFYFFLQLLVPVTRNCSKLNYTTFIRCALQRQKAMATYNLVSIKKIAFVLFTFALFITHVRRSYTEENYNVCTPLWSTENSQNHS
jgi:hypothetical protein